MKKIAWYRRKIFLILSFVIGFLLTFTLSFEKLQQYKLLFMILFFAAAAVDILFLFLLHKLLQKTLYSVLSAQMKRMASALAGRLTRLAAKVVGRSGDKVFLDGKNERKFVFDVYGNKSQKTHRRMPKLSKNANERERIRYEYTAYVFKKDKNISSALTPNEVEKELEATAEEHDIFANYNFARYTAE